MTLEGHPEGLEVPEIRQCRARVTSELHAIETWKWDNCERVHRKAGNRSKWPGHYRNDD
jgi:hypothetical protein